MGFIEILSIVSDFLFVFVWIVVPLALITYNVCNLLRGKSVKDCTNEALTSSSASCAFSCVHNVKILPEYFEGVINGTKPFEFRKNDRGYKPGDCVCLSECIIDEDDGFKREIYTGRDCFVVIKEIFKLGSIDPAFPEYVVFTFSIIKIVEGEDK